MSFYVRKKLPPTFNGPIVRHSWPGSEIASFLFFTDVSIVVGARDDCEFTLPPQDSSSEEEFDGDDSDDEDDGGGGKLPPKPRYVEEEDGGGGEPPAWSPASFSCGHTNPVRRNGGNTNANDASSGAISPVEDRSSAAGHNIDASAMRLVPDPQQQSRKNEFTSPSQGSGSGGKRRRCNTKKKSNKECQAQVSSATAGSFHVEGNGGDDPTQPPPKKRKVHTADCGVNASPSEEEELSVRMRHNEPCKRALEEDGDIEKIPLLHVFLSLSFADAEQMLNLAEKESLHGTTTRLTHGAVTITRTVVEKDPSQKQIRLIIESLKNVDFGCSIASGPPNKQLTIDTAKDYAHIRTIEKDGAADTCGLQPGDVFMQNESHATPASCQGVLSELAKLSESVSNCVQLQLVRQADEPITRKKKRKLTPREIQDVTEVHRQVAASIVISQGVEALEDFPKLDECLAQGSPPVAKSLIALSGPSMQNNVGTTVVSNCPMARTKKNRSISDAGANKQSSPSKRKHDDSNDESDSDEKQGPPKKARSFFRRTAVDQDASIQVTASGDTIKEPHEHDVLCGRFRSWKGNERFRTLVEKRTPAHLMARFKTEKRLIASSIVQEIQSLDPPGRFLSRNAKKGTWFVIDDDKATDEVFITIRVLEKKKASENILNTVHEEDPDDANWNKILASSSTGENACFVGATHSGPIMKSIPWMENGMVFHVTKETMDGMTSVPPEECGLPKGTAMPEDRKVIFPGSLLSIPGKPHQRLPCDGKKKGERDDDVAVNLPTFREKNERGHCEDNVCGQLTIGGCVSFQHNHSSSGSASGNKFLMFNWAKGNPHRDNFIQHTQRNNEESGRDRKISENMLGNKSRFIMTKDKATVPNGCHRLEFDHQGNFVKKEKLYHHDVVEMLGSAAAAAPCPPHACPTPTTGTPTTASPSTAAPTTGSPATGSPTTGSPTTASPTTATPTVTTGSPSAAPTMADPTTGSPTTLSSTTGAPTTASPSTAAPTSAAPTTRTPTTASPTTGSPHACPTPTAAPTPAQAPPAAATSSSAPAGPAGPAGPAPATSTTSASSHAAHPPPRAPPAPAPSSSYPPPPQHHSSPHHHCPPTYCYPCPCHYPPAAPAPGTSATTTSSQAPAPGGAPAPALAPSPHHQHYQCNHYCPMQTATVPVPASANARPYTRAQNSSSPLQMNGAGDLSQLKLAITFKELHDSVKEQHKLKAKEIELFDCLADGRKHNKKKAQEALGVKGRSTFGRLMTTLKKNGMAGFDRENIWLACKMFEVEGRPLII